VVVVGFLFHQHPLKGTNDSITIMHKLKNEFPDKVHIVGVGEFRITNTPKWLQYLANPTRKELAEIMSQTDIWLSSSHSEGLGRLTLEAMSAGCTIVSTDTNAEFLTDGVNSLLFPIADTEAGTECIYRVFNDTELAMQLRAASYATACACADPAPYISNIERVLRGVV
jgi:glycosyltransferase involved in cell wall biosynthesis